MTKNALHAGLQLKLGFVPDPTVTVTDLCDTTIGISENEITTSSKILVYPNPSSGIFTIEGITNESWQIHNGMGQLIKEGSGTQVNLSDYPKGMYLLRVGEHARTLKMLKQ